MLCACGCGKTTELSKRTDAKRGLRKGEPLPFLQSHWFRKDISDCVYKGREKEYRDEWRKQNPELWAMVVRRSWLKRKYGITLEDEAEMLKKQGGGCAICGTTEPGRKARYFHVDHDHETQRVRGLLCAYCNTAIGQMKHDPDRLRAAIDYLIHGTSPE